MRVKSCEAAACDGDWLELGFVSQLLGCGSLSEKLLWS